jgi:hypothetical protein
MIAGDHDHRRVEIITELLRVDDAAQASTTRSTFADPLSTSFSIGPREGWRGARRWRAMKSAQPGMASR